MDIETAKAIRSSTHWDAIKAEIDSWINGQLQRTKTCSAEDIRSIQSRISAYEEVKRLPDIVIDRQE